MGRKAAPKSIRQKPAQTPRAAGSTPPTRSPRSHQQRQRMPADPLAACPGQQWPEQAANTPQLRHMGVGPHQRIIPVALTNQHQRQGEQAPALAPNSTHSGQIAGECSSNGIARLDTSRVTAQPVNRARRDI